MRDHNNAQTNTPNRSSTFVYDGNDRSSSNISLTQNFLLMLRKEEEEYMPFSSRMRRSSVTVNIHGVATRGFCINGLSGGNDS